MLRLEHQDAQGVQYPVGELPCMHGSCQSVSKPTWDLWLTFLVCQFPVPNKLFSNIVHGKHTFALHTFPVAKHFESCFVAVVNIVQPTYTCCCAQMMLASVYTVPCIALSPGRRAKEGAGRAIQAISAGPKCCLTSQHCNAGTVFRHKKFGYKGVIYGWDKTCDR